MGGFISRFRKKKSTKEVLDDIQTKIEEIEEYKVHTEQQRKWLVGSLVVYSIVVYLIAAVFVYIYYLPSELNRRLLYATPFAIFPLLVYLFKRLLTWYYRRKVEKNELRLKDLHVEKMKILDQVMETETYKVAKEILQKHAPDQLHQSLLGRTPTGTPQQFGTPSSSRPGGEVRRRIVPSTPVTGGGGIRGPVPPGHQTPQFTSTRPIISPQSAVIRPGMNSGIGGGPPPGPPMPRPVLPRERGFLDRFIEYLVGDGPANRYALVCRQCESHNGMALKEEFEYIAFRCAYCFYWNPARKQRPSAPRLESLAPRDIGGVSAAVKSLAAAADDEEEEEEESSSAGDEEKEDSGSSSEDDVTGDEDDDEGLCSSSESSSTKAVSSQGSQEGISVTPSTSTTTSDDIQVAREMLSPTSSSSFAISSSSSTTTPASNSPSHNHQSSSISSSSSSGTTTESPSTNGDIGETLLDKH